MPKTRKQKEETLKRLDLMLKNMKSVVFANFDTVGVKTADKLRKACRDEGVQVIVAKKTILARALKNALYEGEDYNFEGGIASFFSTEDEVAGPRIIKQFSKESPGLDMVGGIVNNEFYNKARITQLAALPAKDVLLAKAVGSIAAPLSGMLGVLSGSMRQFVRVLLSIKDTK